MRSDKRRGNIVDAVSTLTGSGRLRAHFGLIRVGSGSTLGRTRAYAGSVSKTRKRASDVSARLWCPRFALCGSAMWAFVV